MVPNNPSALGIATLDGKDEWWPGQREVVEAIVAAFESGKRFVLANMPPGSGKTIVATAVQRMLRCSSINLTHSIMLEHQYAKTLPWATLVTGRRNHKCELPQPLDMPLTAEHAICSVGDDCEYMRPDGCSYYRMLFAAAQNAQIIVNYAYATRIVQLKSLKALRLGDAPTNEGEVQQMIGGGKNPFHRDLLVCDEGDLAEAAIVQAARLVFNPTRWKKILAPLPTSLSLADWIEWATNMGCDAADSYVSEATARVAKTSNTENLKRRTRAVNMHRAVYKLASLDAEAGDWIVGIDGENMIVRPIWGWSVADDILWKPYPRVLIMSATLGSPEVIMKKLGIAPEAAEYIDVPSTFPVQNRPVFYWPVVAVSRKCTGFDWDRLASAIKFIADQPRLATMKGMIHTGSFAVARELHDRLSTQPGGQRFMTHGRLPGDGARAVELFNDSFNPIVLITPSFTTGLDLPYTIGWQVIAKVPFGDLGDEIVKRRREYVLANGVKFGKSNYDDEAMNTVVQAAGRAMRAPDDSGVSYILDSNFWFLYKRAYVPSYFREAFRWLKN